MIRVRQLPRRAWVLALGVAVAAMLALAISAPHAHASGPLVTPEGSTAHVHREEAAISWDGQTERILLSLSALSDSGEAAFLMPTPTPAQVSVGDEKLFAELEALTSPRLEVHNRWWPGAQEEDTDDDVAEPGREPAPVHVVDQVDLGTIEATVLSASDPDELATWLAEHDFVMSDELAEAMAPYVSEGWHYVAVRMTTTQALNGELPVLDITFESSSLVYPMRMSAAATAPQHVRTYVFADQKVARADATANDVGVDLRYAGTPDPDAVGNDTLAQLLTDGSYLTVIDQSFYAPGSEIVSDFHFERSGEGGDFRDVVVEEQMVSIAGQPAGPVLLVAVLVLGALGAGTLLVLRRRRRPQVWRP